MLHRVLALLLTAATVGAPLSLALCHVECADAAALPEPAHHSCHESSEPGALAIAAVSHACGHAAADDAPAGLERAPQTVVAPVAVMASDAWSPAPERVAVDRGAAVDTSPPPSGRLIQLRV